MKEHMRIIDKNQKSGSRPRNLRRRNAFLIFWHSNFAAVATATWWPEIQKFFFAIESTNHVLACHARGFLIFATWWRYRANENLHWNFLERHPVADTIHVIHHSNRLDELIPNMYNTWVVWPLLVKKMVRVDRFWSFHLVCSEHTTYTHHSNRLDKLIPNIYDIWVNFIDLTIFGQKNGQSWPFLVISFSLFI